MNPELEEAKTKLMESTAQLKEAAQRLINKSRIRGFIKIKNPKICL